jgi:multimeric flavodoxin WrbA
MEFAEARPFMERHHRGVVMTRQPDGATQASIALCGVYQEQAAFVSVRGTAAKVRHLRRDAYRACGDKEHPDWVRARPGHAATGGGSRAGATQPRLWPPAVSLGQSVAAGKESDGYLAGIHGELSWIVGQRAERRWRLKMKILGILGSAREGGNTEVLLDTALDEAQKQGVLIDKIPLRDKSIAPCDGCQACNKTGKCIIDDDAQDIYKAMLAADGIIWATPVYFWSMSGQTKILMDRTYALLFPKLQLAGKVGGLIIVAAGRGCMNTANVFHMYFTYNHMFFPEFVSGYARNKGDIKKKTSILNMAKEMVNQMICLINADLKYPEEFDVTLSRYVMNKYE